MTKKMRAEYEIILDDISTSARIAAPSFQVTGGSWVGSAAVTLQGEDETETRTKLAARLRALADAVDPSK